MDHFSGAWHSEFDTNNFGSPEGLLPRALRATSPPEMPDTTIETTSHTRLSACDHYISSTLIGGKGGAGPSLLHTMLEGAIEYVNARWM
jgi:hypothetical protein